MVEDHRVTASSFFDRSTLAQATITESGAGSSLSTRLRLTADRSDGDELVNLHLKIGSMIPLGDAMSPNKASYSVSRRSIRQLTMAETMLSSQRSRSRLLSNGSQWGDRDGGGGGGTGTGSTESDLLHDNNDLDAQQQQLSEKAMLVINRVMDKLTGLDFSSTEVLDIPEQVDKLVVQAMSNENLCLIYIGWCPFW